MRTRWVDLAVATGDHMTWLGERKLTGWRPKKGGRYMRILVKGVVLKTENIGGYNEK